MSILGALLLAPLAPASGASHVDGDEIKYVLPPDAIPAITKPKFDDGKWLDDDDMVIGVRFHGTARAYPLRILNWHEIVDDKIGTTNFAVTYCPLCGTGIVFDRTIARDGEETILTLKVSGRLFMSDLVMYDTQTDSLWAQTWGEAIRGELHGTTLDLLPSALVTWREWRKANPEGVVLSRETGYGRNYDQDPYQGYSSNRDIGISGKSRDDVFGMHPKEFVLGVDAKEGPLAFRYQRLAQERVVPFTLDGNDVVVTFHDDAAHLFDAAGHDFRFVRDGVMADERDREWSMTAGQLLNGTLRLERLAAIPAFWFAWYDFHRDTRVWGALGVAATNPGHRAGNVDPNTTIFIRFTDALVDPQREDPATIIDIEPKVSGEWRWVDAASVEFTPEEPLADGHYRVEVHKNATDVHNNTLGRFHVFLFTVGGPAPGGADGRELASIGVLAGLVALVAAAILFRRKR